MHRGSGLRIARWLCSKRSSKSLGRRILNLCPSIAKQVTVELMRPLLTRLTTQRPQGAAASGRTSGASRRAAGVCSRTSGARSAADRKAGAGKKT